MLKEEILIAVGGTIAFLLLLMSAFFSASETGLVSLSAHKAKRLAIRNPNLRQALTGWLSGPHDLLTLILIGNTVVNILFATLLTGLAVYIFKNFSPSLVETIVWLAETIIVVLVGDMGPKFYARAHPEKVSLRVLPILSTLRRLAHPLFVVISSMRFLFPKSKPQPVGEVLTFSMEELKGLMDEGQSHNLSEDSVGMMMKKVLEINNSTAKDIMTPMERVELIEIDPKGKPKRSRELLLDLVIEHGHTRTPVKEASEIIGFIHSDDLLPLILNDKKKEITKMVRAAIDVPADQSVGDLLQEFRSGGVYFGFVRGKDNEIIGVVSLEDVLEEITGEITDEYDISYK